MKKFCEFIKEKWNIVLYFACFIAAIVAVLIVGIDSRNRENYFENGVDKEISSGWTCWYENGEKQQVSLPANLDKSEVKTLYLQRTLPEVTNHDHLIFKAKHTLVKITIDGEVVFDRLTDSPDKDRWYALEGIYYAEVEMKQEYSGKEIVIESFSTEKRYLSRPGEVFLGERGMYISEKTRGGMATYVCFVIMIVVAGILLALWITALLILKMNAKEILSLIFFTFSVALWLYTESELVQILGRSTRELTILALEILILLPVPIALFFYYVGVRNKGKLASRIAATIPLIWFLIANLLHVCHLVSLTSSLLATQILLGVELVGIAAIQISEIQYIHTDSKKYGKRMGKVPMVGIGVLVPFALYEISKYVFIIPGLKQNGVFLSVGVMVYIMSLAIDWVVRISYNQARIEQGTELKTQFLADMSHEIRTPLNAMLGFNEAIVQSPDDVEAVREYAKNIREAGNNLKEIINSILDISKIEMGQLQIESREYDSVELFDSLATMFGLLAEKKNLKFNVEIDPQIPMRLIGDEPHIRQVLTNILSNAIKYTDKGSVRFKVSLVEMSSDSPLCKLKFSVKDTGRGIKEEDREKLFEKFQRLDTKHFAHTEGTGLGMSIVLFTLKAMGSQIQFDSVFNEGSDFYFEIDQVAIDRQGIGDFETVRLKTANEEVKNIEFRAPKAEILIVDDVAMNIESAKAMLKYTNMNIDGALSGREALQKIQQKHYDIIFMDHMMPEMDGIETTEEIRNLSVTLTDSYYAAVPVIALTANVMVGVREMYQQAGMQDFVSKPIQIGNIISVLHKWLPAELIEKADANEIAKHVAFSEAASKEEWTIDINGIDAEYAKQYNVNFEGLVKNIQSYEHAYESNKKQIEDYYSVDDIKNYIIKVHGLKSTSKMIGARELYMLAKSIETLGNTEGKATEDDFKKLMALYDKQISYIRAYLEANASEESEEISEEDYHNLLIRIKKAGETYDAATFMWLDDELRNTNVPAAHAEEFKEIRLKVSLLQYSEAVVYLESLGY